MSPPHLLQIVPSLDGSSLSRTTLDAAQAAIAAAGEIGTISKLTRVMMLAPVVIALGAIAARRAKNVSGEASTAKAPLPTVAAAQPAAATPAG